MLKQTQRFVCALSVVWCLASCDEQPPAPREPPALYPVVPPSTAIDANRARELVLERYRHLFGNAYWHDSRDDSYKPFPALELERFRSVHREGDVWIVKCDPLAGYNVRARVAADGSWVELEHVGYSAR